jgi:hypothetical protein
MKLSLSPQKVEINYIVYDPKSLKKFGTIRASSAQNAIDKIRKTSQCLDELVAEATGEIFISYIEQPNDGE